MRFKKITQYVCGEQFSAVLGSPYINVADMDRKVTMRRLYVSARFDYFLLLLLPIFQEMEEWWELKQLQNDSGTMALYYASISGMCNMYDTGVLFKRCFFFVFGLVLKFSFGKVMIHFGLSDWEIINLRFKYGRSLLAKKLSNSRESPQNLIPFNFGVTLNSKS